MGGVDVMDRLLGSYRPVLRSKKWFWNLFNNMLNLVVVAAWKLHVNVMQDKMPHLQFRRDLVIALLAKSRQPNLKRRRGGPTTPTPKPFRISGQHFLVKAYSQGRCVYCSRNTTKMCKSCDKRIHERCTADYHS